MKNKSPLAWWTENGPSKDGHSWAYHEARAQEDREIQAKKKPSLRTRFVKKLKAIWKYLDEASN